MLIDRMENIHYYAPLLPNLEKGLEAISNLKKKGEFAPGRYDFDGGFFKVENGTTKSFEEGTYEAHKKYIDVQIIEGGRKKSLGIL